MLYFAYGSNMLHERMQKRVPSAKPLFVAVLLDHSFRFHKVSKDGSGKADAYVETGSNVFGVVYHISRCHKRALDAFEGRPNHYQMKWVTVYDSMGLPCKVFTYYAVIIDPKFVPFQSYKTLVLAGAVQNELPVDYVERIEAVESKPDPVAEGIVLKARESVQGCLKKQVKYKKEVKVVEHKPVVKIRKKSK